MAKLEYMEWTQDEEELLNDMWVAGYTAAEIAHRLDRTRNQVIGKRSRLIDAGKWKGSESVGRNRTRYGIRNE